MHVLYRNQRPCMTFNGHYALHCTKRASFGAKQIKKFDKDRPALSAGDMYTNHVSTHSQTIESK